MVTGEDILKAAAAHIGEAYILGAFVPKDLKGYRGPWDCAELASKIHYDEAGILYGTSNHIDPRTADAWSGFWLADAREKGKLVPIANAARTPGAVILRIGVGTVGHVVIADGRGGTVEAACARLGVIKGVISGRRWTHGVLVPGIAYQQMTPVAMQPPQVIRLTNPFTRGQAVVEIQKALHSAPDGVYGPQTYAAVLEFQRQRGLVADGEVGPQTLKELGLPEGLLRRPG